MHILLHPLRERGRGGGGNREDEGADSAEMGMGTEGVDRHIYFPHMSFLIW